MSGNMKEWEVAVVSSIGPCRPENSIRPTSCEAHDSLMNMPEMCVYAAGVFRAAEAAVAIVLQQVIHILENAGTDGR